MRAPVTPPTPGRPCQRGAHNSLIEVSPGTPQGTGPLTTPRPASYYLDLPVSNLEESRLSELDDSELLMLRAGRTADIIAGGTLDDALARVGDLCMVTAGSLPR